MTPLLPDARSFHFHFKYLVGRLALHNPARFFSTFGEGGDSDYLFQLWRGMSEKVSERERIAPEGLALHRFALEGAAVIAVAFPTPVAANEAYFVAAVSVDLAVEAVRVFCLERASLPDRPDTTAVLEWSDAGRAHFGPAASADLDGFTACLGDILRGRREPISFAPLPI